VRGGEATTGQYSQTAAASSDGGGVDIDNPDSTRQVSGIVNLIQIIGEDQVMLKVTVAEVKRDVSKELGINLSSTFSIGDLTGSFNNTTTDLANGVQGEFPLNMPFGTASVDMAIRALETNGAIRLLAEPVLTATSGQQANFLAGGEFPFRTGTDDQGNPIITYKEFGVKLGFTPTIKAGGQIDLVVNTSVSEPQTDGSLNKREVSTNVELGVGQTLSIAGLLDERIRHQINRLPGLGDIPILGALFRSREFVSSKTELVFLVTPYIAQPVNGKVELPTDNVALANDAEAIFLGHIETVYGVGPAGTRGSYDGNVGFLLD
jgi:pilus assembly protein CpaC